MGWRSCLSYIYNLNISIKNCGSLQAYCKAANNNKKKLAFLKMIIFFPVCKCAHCVTRMHSPPRNVRNERQQEAVPLLSLQACLMNRVSMFSWSRCRVPLARAKPPVNALQDDCSRRRNAGCGGAGGNAAERPALPCSCRDYSPGLAQE